MWRDLTREEKDGVMCALGKWAPPGSALEENLGMRYDQAESDGRRFGLLPEQVLKLDGSGMSQVRNVDDFQQAQRRLAESEEVRAQARRDLELESIKAALRDAP